MHQVKCDLHACSQAGANQSKLITWLKRQDFSSKIVQASKREPEGVGTFVNTLTESPRSCPLCLQIKLDMLCTCVHTAVGGPRGTQQPNSRDGTNVIRMRERE